MILTDQDRQRGFITAIFHAREAFLSYCSRRRRLSQEKVSRRPADSKEGVRVEEGRYSRSLDTGPERAKKINELFWGRGKCWDQTWKKHLWKSLRGLFEKRRTLFWNGKRESETSRSSGEGIMQDADTNGHIGVRKRNISTHQSSKTAWHLALSTKISRKGGPSIRSGGPWGGGDGARLVGKMTHSLSTGKRINHKARMSDDNMNQSRKGGIQRRQIHSGCRS